MPDGGRFWVKAIVAFVTLVLAVILLLPMLDVDRRQAANEASAVSRLRRIGELQDRYRDAHPASGFACKLGNLKPIGPIADLYDPESFLIKGEIVGYRFAMSACISDKSGLTFHSSWASAAPSGPTWASVCLPLVVIWAS
jgi:hypothetical protein